MRQKCHRKLAKYKKTPGKPGDYANFGERASTALRSAFVTDTDESNTGVTNVLNIGTSGAADTG